MNFLELIDSKQGVDIDTCARMFPPWARSSAQRLENEPDKVYQVRLKELFLDSLPQEMRDVFNK